MAITALIIFGTSAAAAQSGNIDGLVTGPEGNPVSGASVTTLDGTSRHTTDPAGRFRLGGLQPITHRVIVRYVGFAPETTQVAVRPNQTSQVRVQLRLTAIALPGITVEGERGGQLGAINRQRASNTVVSVVAADEIGMLPDQNVAEATQRLAGIYVETDRGEGRTVSIRGTAPRLNSVTLNGMPLASSGRSRATPLDLLPADMVSGIEVTKAVTADMDGNSIGGSIDISTLTAFDRAEPFLQASLEGMRHEQEANILSKKFPFEASMTAGRRFGADETWGIVVGGNYSRRDFGVAGLSANWWELEDHPGIYHPEDIEFQVEDNERTRYGLTSSLDWRPRAGTRFSLNALYTRTRELASNSEYQIAFEPDDVQDVTATGAYYPEGASDLDLSTSNTRQDLLSLTLSGEQRLGESLTWSFAGTGTRGDLKGGGPDAAFAITHSPERMATRLDLRDFFFGIDHDDADFLRDPLNYSNRLVNDNRRVFVERNWVASTDLRWDTRVGSLPAWLKGGAKLLMRDKDVDFELNRYFSGSMCRGGATCEVTALEPFAINDRFPIPGGYDVYVQGNTSRVLDYFYTHRDDPTRYQRNEFLSTWKSLDRDGYNEERITAAYLMSNIDIGTLSVLAGVRAEHTKTSSTRHFLGESTVGPRADRTLEVSDPETFEKSYTNLLPSVVLRYEASPNLLLRAAWSNTIGRPDYQELSQNSYATYSEVATQPGTYRGNVVAANPDLEPYESMNLDATAEYYFPTGGVVSVAGFQKRIDNPIFKWEETQRNLTVEGMFFEQLRNTQTRNATKGTVRGVEFNYAQPLYFLPRPLDGFGITLNAAFIDSDVTIPGRDEDLPFFGQASSIVNFIPYYQRGPAEVRAAWSHRGGYLSQVGSAPHLDVYADSRTTLDLSGSYQLTAWSAEIFAQVRNVTNEAEREYWSDPGRIAEYFKVGRTFSLGMRLKL